MHLSTASGEVEGALVKTAPWIRTSETIPTDSRQAKRSKRHGGTVVSVLLVGQLLVENGLIPSKDMAVLRSQFAELEPAFFCLMQCFDQFG